MVRLDLAGQGHLALALASGHIQIELGLDDLSIQHRGGITTSINDAGGLLAKIGVTPAVDVEAGINLYQSERAHGGGVTSTQSGVGRSFPAPGNTIPAARTALPWCSIPISSSPLPRLPLAMAGWKAVWCCP